MSFLHPLLFGVGAGMVAIPIVIHFLFRRRRKPIVWAAMRFLYEAYKKHQRRLKLEQFLLLAARCLLILLVALALGRPVAESASAALGLGGGRTVYVVLDDSLAGSARHDGADETALDRHKNSAKALLASLGPGDRAALVTLATPARSVVLPASSDISAVSALIDEIRATDAAADFAGAFSAVSRDLRDAERGRGSATVAVYSEFRAGSADLSRALPPTFEGLERVRLSASAPSAAAAGNVQIVAVEPLRRVALARESAGVVDARVRLRRTGPIVGERGVTTVRLALARSLETPADAASAVVRWSPGQSEAEVVLPARPTADADAETAALVAWIDRDAVGGDNRAARPVQVRDAIRVGVADRPRFGPMPGADRLEPADWFRLALAPTEAAPIEVTDVDPAAIDTPTLARLDALVVPRPDLLDAEGWGRLASFARAGGVVVVTPPTGAGVHLWSDAMTEAFGLPWRIAREAVEAGEESAVSLAPSERRAGLFELIASELPGLARSVQVFRHVPVIEGASAPGVTVPIALSTGEPWLVLGTPGASATEESAAFAGTARGLVAYIASAPALAWTTLPARPMFVPLVQELIRQGVGEAGGGGAFVAGSRPIAPARTSELVALGGDQAGRREPIDARGSATEPIRRAGLWRAIDAAGLERGLLAVNADIDAGRTETQSPDEVRAWLSGTGVAADSIVWLDEYAGAGARDALRAAAAGAGWSRWLLFAALAVALAELIMARLFSHATRSPSAGGAAG